MKIAGIILAGIIAAALALYYILIGNTDKSAPVIIRLDAPVKVVGLEIHTSDSAIYNDVGIVAARFNEIKEKHPIPDLKEPWAAVNISKDYDPGTRTFNYIVGEVVTCFDSVPEGLDRFEVPAISYAIFRIRPRSRFAWGITMGRMKRFIYTEWLPSSGYRPSELIGDFELHDERSLGKRPEVQLYVAVVKKEKE